MSTLVVMGDLSGGLRINPQFVPLPDQRPNARSHSEPGESAPGARKAPRGCSGAGSSARTGAGARC